MLLNFVSQDLRHRSFRGQMLNGADFSGADIRGCDFSRAQLVGANFQRSQAGQTRRQQGIWLAIAIISFLVVGHAVSNLVFSSMGQTPADKAWNYVLVLCVSLGIAGGFSGIRFGTRGRYRPLNRVAIILSSTASGAVSGFFYVGIATGKEAKWAIAGAILGGLLAGLVGFHWGKKTSISLLISISGAICAYGWTFFVGSTALSFFNTHHWQNAMLLAVLALGYLWLTVRSLVIALHTFRHAPGTHFTHANLTDAQFTSARLDQTDFSGATG